MVYNKEREQKKSISYKYAYILGIIYFIFLFFYVLELILASLGGVFIDAVFYGHKDYIGDYVKCFTFLSGDAPIFFSSLLSPFPFSAFVIYVLIWLFDRSNKIVSKFDASFIAYMLFLIFSLLDLIMILNGNCIKYSTIIDIMKYGF